LRVEIGQRRAVAQQRRRAPLAQRHAQAPRQLLAELGRVQPGVAGETRPHVVEAQHHQVAALERSERPLHPIRRDARAGVHRHLAEREA
jgi:hypothetical protein